MRLDFTTLPNSTGLRKMKVLGVLAEVGRENKTMVMLDFPAFTAFLRLLKFYGLFAAHWPN